MKVALSFPGCNRRGGIERVIYECAKFLSQRGHEVTVFASRYEPGGVAIRYHHVPTSRTLRKLEPLAFHHACDQGDYEIAEQLLHILETMLTRRTVPPGSGCCRQAQGDIARESRRLMVLDED